MTVSWGKLVSFMKQFDSNQPCPSKYSMIEGMVKALQKMIVTCEDMAKTQKQINSVLQSSQAKQAHHNIVMQQGVPNMNRPPIMPRFPGMNMSLNQNSFTPVAPDTAQIVRMAMEKIKKKDQS